MKKQKILIISQYFPPDIAGGATRAYNYAKILSKHHNVTVITAFPHLHDKVPKLYRGKLIYHENEDGINLIRVWIPSILHTSAIKRILLHLSFIISSLFPLLSLKPDIILASEPNLFSIIPAFFYSKLRGGKVLRIVDDLWPEVIYERGYVKSKILKKILDCLAKFSYNFPKYIIPLTEEAKNHIVKLYEIRKEKITVLEHGIDTKIFRDIERKKNGFFTLMYSGSIVESYDFDIILNAAKKLQNENIKFIIRGKGLLVPYLLKQKKLHKLDNLQVETSLVSFSELAETLGKADVFLIPMKDDYFLNLSLPTKILEYQAIGRPIVCCSNGAPSKYIEKTNSGLVTKSGDLNGFIKAIRKLESDEILYSELGENGRKHVEKYLTFDKLRDRLESIISMTVSAKK